MSGAFSLSLLDPVFVGLLAVLVASRLVTPRRWHSAIGAAASVALVGAGSAATLVMIGGMTLLVLYPLALGISRVRRAQGTGRPARPLLAFGTLAVLGAWLLFKLNREMPIPAVRESDIGAQLLGVMGFSYFLFKAINYLYMHYLVEIPNSTPARALHYTLFPPVLTSGPIQKFTDFSRQADSPVPLDLANLATGVYRITKGYFYKVCIAAALQQWADALLLAEAPSAYQSLATIALLYLFFFFDFAGYCHIAIGLALLLGIRVPENFKKPFLATSLTEFWRNWHVTLADWFRDHVFIPLGGMRMGGLRAALIAGGIMVACGFWHGLTLPFVAWGLWHGLNLLLEGVLGSKPMPPAERHGPRYWLRVLSTNARVAMGAVFFLPSLDAVVRLLEGFLRW